MPTIDKVRYLEPAEGATRPDSVSLLGRLSERTQHAKASRVDSTSRPICTTSASAEAKVS